VTRAPISNEEPYLHRERETFIQMIAFIAFIAFISFVGAFIAFIVYILARHVIILTCAPIY
jgi:hypothetical protein